MYTHQQQVAGKFFLWIPFYFQLLIFATIWFCNLCITIDIAVCMKISVNKLNQKYRYLVHVNGYQSYNDINQCVS